MKDPAEMQDMLVACQDVVVLFQIIPDSAIPFVRVLLVNLLNYR